MVVIFKLTLDVKSCFGVNIGSEIRLMIAILLFITATFQFIIGMLQFMIAIFSEIFNVFFQFESLTEATERVRGEGIWEVGYL